MLTILEIGMIVGSALGATEATPYKTDVIYLFYFIFLQILDERSNLHSDTQVLLIVTISVSVYSASSKLWDIVCIY